MTSAAPPPATRKRRIFRLVAALLLPVLALVLLEGGLRIGGFEHPPAAPFFRFGNPERLLAENDAEGPSVPDPDIFWRMRPGWRTPDGRYHVRASGFRTPAFSPRKKPRWTRIVCVGDSSVFGMGVDEPDSWPRLLEHAVCSKLETDAAEVVNLGCPGYTVFQGAVLMDHMGFELDADVVVLGFGGFNDWVPAVGHRDSRQGRLVWWQRLRLVQLVLSFRGDDEPEVGEASADEAMKVLRTLDTRDVVGDRRVPLGEFGAILGRIAAEAEERGARVVLLASPLPAKTLGNNPIAADYADAVRRVARAGGHALVDGPEAFEASGLADEVLFVDFCHPTARGHALLADAILVATGLGAD